MLVYVTDQHYAKCIANPMTIDILIS